MSTIGYRKCSTTKLEPCKRVKYSQGLVLGVDEFQQEQHYFLERLRLHHRGINGYGTVCGLDVSTRERGGVRELVVEPGWAIGPHGREIKVGTTQCANLDSWVANEVHEAGSPALVVRYLVLCHRECETDHVPIPGGPCRSLDESSAPSRILESFELKLAEAPPDQVEEDSVRALGEFLRQIEIDDQATSFTTQEELDELVRGLMATGSPLTAAEAPIASPAVVLHPDDAARAIRAALLVWATEVRPTLSSKGCALTSGTSCEDCVLLARIELDVDAGATPLLIVGDPRIDESDRPYLLSTRVLQELFGLNLGAGSTTIVLPPAETSPAEVGITEHSQLGGLQQDDHEIYLLHDGTRPLSQDWIVNPPPADPTIRIKRVADGIEAGDVVTFDQAVKFADAIDAAHSDLIGTYGDPRVKGLRGRTVSNQAPNPQDVLRWDATALEWRPSAIVIPTPTPQLPDNIETGLTRILMTSWVHGGSTNFEVTLDDDTELALVVLFGVERVGDMPVQVRVGSLDARSFQMFVERPSGIGASVAPLRFPPQRIVPVTVDPGGPVSATVVKTASSGNEVFGAAYVLDRKEVERSFQSGEVLSAFEVLLRCDFIRDVRERAVDGEHLRGALPTGDRPELALHGIQGGRFESWAVFDSAQPFLNFEGPEVLVTLRGITEARANAIVRLRPFTDIDDLRTRTGNLPDPSERIPASTITRLERLVRFDT